MRKSDYICANGKKQEIVMTKYNEEECAIIYRSKDKWGALGNMTMGFPIVLDNKTRTSSEALYQACKFENKL